MFQQILLPMKANAYVYTPVRDKHKGEDQHPTMSLTSLASQRVELTRLTHGLTPEQTAKMVATGPVFYQPIRKVFKRIAGAFRLRLKSPKQ